MTVPTPATVHTALTALATVRLAELLLQATDNPEALSVALRGPFTAADWAALPSALKLTLVARFVAEVAQHGPRAGA